MNLERYNGRRIALVMDVQGRDVVLRGVISFRKDSRQGIMLQIAVDTDDNAAMGCPRFLISENRWKHDIASGFVYDCDFLLDLSQSTVAAG